MVETLPAGYAFAGTGNPDDRVLVRGQEIGFAVMNDTRIAYSVTAPHMVPVRPGRLQGGA